MKSPHTGKHMPIQCIKANMEFKGEHFWVWYLCYYCEQSDKRYTNDDLDKVNTYQVYQQYAAKHYLPIEEVMPKSEPCRFVKDGECEVCVTWPTCCGYEKIINIEHKQAVDDLFGKPKNPSEQDKTLNFHKIIAETPQEIKDYVDKHLDDLDQQYKDQLELLTCPGDTIQETLKAKGMHLLDFAIAMDRLPEEINDIITGKTPINKFIADQLENVLGIDAQFWLNYEANYRAKLAKLTNRKP